MDLQLHFLRLQTADKAALPLPSAPRYMLSSLRFGASPPGSRPHVSLRVLFVIGIHLIFYSHEWQAARACLNITRLVEQTGSSSFEQFIYVVKPQICCFFAPL